MRNTITIERNGLQQQIDLRNHYMGESAKRKDPDATTIQSSKDDKDLLRMFIDRACNELVTAVALRFPYISCTAGEENIEIACEHVYKIKNRYEEIMKILNEKKD